ncbi:unnamed protein product [Adineta steineri]|uniref:TRPM-like domain-containing protein n=1 Tax=Adineta steineri TaxID=433720 RepID=A0A814SEN7_9BILA|nr:unnamed protein product [Adineta steineri]CAF1318168.1 unnamed protein product [Adineta steineri]
MLRSLCKFRLNFVNDVRKLYNIVRQQNYETQEEKDLVIVLQKLVGDFMLSLYDTQSDNELLSLETEGDAEHIYRDLFLWCILTYRRDMAKIFLSQLKTRICSALIASKILKSLAAYAPDQVAKDTLFAKANDFETYAIEFVRCAYINGRHKTCELIMRCTNLYGGVTCLQMAIAADNKRFLHEDACQALLTNIWYDRIDHVQERKRLVVNILTFGISQFFISIYLNRISNLFLVLLAYLLFYIGLALRFTQKDTQSFLSARIVMALDLELSFIRSVLFIGIASDVGPKIVMIRKMVGPMISFYSCSSSLYLFSAMEFHRNIFRAIAYPVYCFVHGSIDNERTQLDATPDSGGNIVTQIIFAFHMLFVNILLMNLLIALFSFTINDIQTQARYVWAYDCCDIIRTYYARSALFPRFTFLISIMQCFQWCWRKLHRNRNGKQMHYEEQSQCFKMIPINDDVDYAWLEFERYSTNGYVRQLLDDQATVLFKGTTADVTSESSSNNADELKRIKTLVTDVQTRFVQMETRCDRWITNMKEITTSMNWMMMAMANAKMGESEPPLIRDTSRISSISQKRHEQLNKEYTTAGQPLLQQERSVTPEVRINMALRVNNNNDV